MAANFIQGCIMGLTMPSLMAIVTETVECKDLMNAVALNNLQMNVSGMLMPSLAGVMIDHMGFESTYYAIAGFYVLAAAYFFFIPKNTQVNYQRGQILANIKNGLKYIGGNRTVLYLLLASLAMIVLAMPYQNLLPLSAMAYSKWELQDGPLDEHVRWADW